MTPERWERVGSLYRAALEHAPGERAAFLRRASGDDQELLREVESLLVAEEGAGHFLSGGAMGDAAKMLVGRRSGSLIGREVGHYRVLSLLGAGGMGEVYLAEDIHLGRRVALKLLPEELTASHDRVRRFEREARAASALNHPNILTVHEFGEADGLRFIVTEYVEGRTLRELIEAGEVRLGQALDTAIQVAAALAAAHEAGVVHRDVKPENVMLRPDGYVKVLDFGLAKLTERAGADGGAESDTLLKLSTQPGLVMGTVSYMSPEQARGLQVDARTDVWSLGVVLYELVAGRAPFQAATTSDMLVSILTKEPPPLSECAPGVPEELQRIVSKALLKDRTERYAAMRDMLEELREGRDEVAFRQRRSRPSGPLGANAGSGSQQLPAGGVTASPVTALAADMGATLPVGSRTSGAEHTARSVGRHKAVALLALALVVALAGAAAIYFYSGREDSLAVLPFVYVSADAGTANDPEREYLSDGLTESIIRDLSQLSDLRVIARSSVFRYKGRESDPREVGRELNVRTVLTGLITQRGDRLTVNAELVEAETGTRLWGERYEVTVADLLRVQNEIAEDISRQLHMRLTEGERRRQLARRHTPDPEAHRLYLKGRYFWNKRTADDLRKAIENFRAAIGKDPDYALAYAGLSDAYSLMTFYTDTPPAAAAPQAREAALKALEKDERLAEGHTALAWVLAEYDWDHRKAVRAFARAIELNPNYALAHHRLGYVLAEAGRFDESVAALQRARDLDPISIYIPSALGATLYYAGRYDEAIVVYKQGIEIDPGNSGIRAHLGDVYRQQGRYAEAIEAYRQAAELLGRADAALNSRIAVTHAKAGDRAEAHKLLEEVLRSGDDREYYAVAAVYAALGDKEQALAWLDKGFEARHPEVTALKVDPQFEGLRSEPRFAEMVRRIGMEP